MECLVYTANAFTADGKNGNGAGIVLEAESLSPEQMLSIAKQVGFSETAFVSEHNRPVRKLHFFTPVQEVPLCGHATIATWSLLHMRGSAPAGDYVQETGAGLLRVCVQQDGLIFMEQAAPEFLDVVPPKRLASLLNLTLEDFHSALPPRIVSTGLKDIMVPLANKASLSVLQPDFDAIAAFTKTLGITGLHVFCLTEPGAPSLALARNFDPADGIDEECATGTSNGALLCYLRQENALPEQELYRIEQGEEIGKRSYIYGKFQGDRVWIGGYATLGETLQVTI